MTWTNDLLLVLDARRSLKPYRLRAKERQLKKEKLRLLQQQEDQAPPAIIPLSQAAACEDCGNITRARNSTCESCGSKAVWSVVNVLDRTKDREMLLWLEQLRTHQQEVEESLGL